MLRGHEETPISRILACLLFAVPVMATADASAQTDCIRVPTQRAVPGGDTFPAFRLVCDDSPSEDLLAPDAARAVCGSPDLPADRMAACEEAVARAQAALRKAKLRSQLRDGADEGVLRQQFDASPEELDRIRDSALRSAAPE